MRVGVYLGDYSPNAGGGFTFQGDIFRAFVRMAGQQQDDEFIVLSESRVSFQDVTTLDLPSNVQVFKFPRRWQVLKFIERLKNAFPFLRRVIRVPGKIARAAGHLGLECIWYVAGGAYEATDTPYIATVWDLEHRLQPWFPEMTARGEWDGREAAYSYFLKRASYVIVGTETGRDEVQDFYQVPSFRIRVLPHPTPRFALDAEDVNVARIREKFSLHDRFLLYPAQFWPHKNHINLLQALVLLRDRYGATPTLVLVGSDKGNLSHVKRASIEYGLAEQVRFLGFVEQQDLVGLYRAASMMVYPSFCGPENLPPLEAFALGCPVAAAGISGAMEQLADAALLFNPRSPGDIAEKIAALETDALLRETLCLRGQMRARQWTAEHFVAEVFGILVDFSAIRRCWP